MSTDIYNLHLPLHNKYYTWYMNICLAKQKERGWFTFRKQPKNLVRHHIIPDSFFIERTRNKKINDGWIVGNPNDKFNLTFLTNKEHFLVHWLLCKCYEGLAKRKVVHAFNRMCNKNKCSVYYVIAIKLFITMKTNSKGPNKTKRWYTNTKEEKLCIPELKPIGWFLGRTLGPKVRNQKRTNKTKEQIKLHHWKTNLKKPA